jgi:lipooligosaccharide transport system permease protein
VSLSLPHALSVWRRDAAMYRRTWRANLLPNFFEPVFYLFALGIGVGTYIAGMGGMSYVEFLAPGLVCVAAMNGASFEVTYNIFVRLNFEKAYDAILTTPVEPDDVLLGEVLWALTRAAIYGGSFLLVAVLFGYAPLPYAPLALPVVILTGLLFASIGITFSLTIHQIDFFSFYFTLFLTPLFLFSGVFFPLEERLSPGWLAVAEALPLLHPVRLARAIFQGHVGLVALWDVAYTLCLCAVLLFWARNLIRRRLMT